MGPSDGDGLGLALVAGLVEPVGSGDGEVERPVGVADGEDSVGDGDGEAFVGFVDGEADGEVVVEDPPDAFVGTPPAAGAVVSDPVARPAAV